jgi:ABC-2 type transport system ATP-binding protein
MKESDIIMCMNIETFNLVKRFGNHEVVKSISFNVKEGEIFGLLGPNGAGKTTTIRMLTTLLLPTSGIIKLSGFDVRRYGSLVRKFIGYVPQALSADSTLTGYENLYYIAKLLRLSKNEREKRIEYVLTLLNLKDAANRLVKEYSGGMVRRLEVGQAILHKPKILILDEPTVGLDPIARHNVWEALKALQKDNGLSILITTHYMEEAEALCQRIAIMNRGLIVAQGTLEELKKAAGDNDISLEDIFIHFAGNNLESGGDFREMRQMRKRIQHFS